MSVNDLQVQRSLGQIESTQAAILKELKEMRADMTSHIASDDARFDNIEADRNKARGAGWVILGLLGGLATVVGGAVIAVISGWLHV